jgi:hypothetical protein
MKILEDATRPETEKIRDSSLTMPRAFGRKE